MSSRFKEIGKVAIPAQPRFVVKDKFATSIAQSNGVEIVWLEDTFEDWFFQKVENQVAATIFRCIELARYEFGKTLFSDLGYKKTMLSQIYWLIAQQPICNRGILLLGGAANIFPVEDEGGILHLVHIRSYGHGWDVFADPVSDQRGWRPGYRLFYPLS